MDDALNSEKENSERRIPFLDSKALPAALCVLLALFLIFLSPILEFLVQRALTSRLVISEVMSSNTSALYDSGHRTPDWIEVHNESAKTLHLAGYSLTNSLTKNKRFVFPAVDIPAGGYLIVYASDNSQSSGDTLSTGFALSKEGETLYLIDPYDNIVQTLAVPALDSNVSYALRPDGTYGYCTVSSPGKANDERAIAANAPVPLAAGPSKPNTAVDDYVASHDVLFDISGVYINEVCAANAANSGKRDWVELYNGSNRAVDLTGYYLSDDDTDPTMWKIPSGTIPANGYFVIEASAAASGASIAPFGVSIEGETLILCNAKGDIVDVFNTGSLRAGITSGRVTGNTQIARAYFNSPTQGKANSAQYCTEYTAEPCFSDNSLYHSGSFQLTLTCSTPNAKIYYTTNGSEPSTSSNEYTGPITLNKNTAVRMMAVADGFIASDSVSRTYLFDAQHTVPVMCISGNASEFSKVLGSNWRDYKPEYAASADYYEADGTLGVSFSAGLRPKGRSSLMYAQNSLSLRLRSGYGQTSVTYPFFGSDSVTTFTALSMRNAGQDNASARIRDPYFETLAETSLDVDGTVSKTVVVYINGSYYGLYDLIEEQTPGYMTAHYGVDENNIDTIEGNGSVVTGDNQEFKKVINYARTWNLSDDKVFAEFAKLVDVNACMDYLVARIYFGDGDVINQRFWRAKDYSVKWRPLLYDFDWSLRMNDANRNVFTKYFSSSPVAGNGAVIHMYIFCGLRKNKAWCDAFVQRFIQMAVTKFSTKNMLSLFDSMVSTMTPEMQQHIARWHTPRSMQAWQTQIGKLRSAIEKRQGIALKQLQNYFHLSDAVMQQYINKYTPPSGN